MKIRIIDIIIFTIFLTLIIFSFTVMGEKGNTLRVTAGENEYRFPLDKDGIYTVDGVIGETVVEIKDGKARFLSSPCKNQTCVLEGFQDFIVCLPNKVVASTESNEGEVDATTR